MLEMKSDNQQTNKAYNRSGYSRSVNRPYARRPEGDRLLNTDEVAEILNTDAETVRWYFRTGRLPGFKVTPDALHWKMFASRLWEICENQEQTFIDRNEGEK